MTRLLNQAGRGDPAAREGLARLVYEEMMKLARSRLAREPRLQGRKAPESLVHEAWIRLIGKPKEDWADRKQFYGYVRRAMWQICVDQIRASAGRAGERPLADWMAELAMDPGELVALDNALNGLAQHSRRTADVVRLRYIEQRSVKETAAILGVSDRTVESEWAFGRAWLRRQLDGDDAGPGAS